MATANEGSDLKCPICLERNVNPRKLPNCSNYFCEDCITTYVVKSLGDGEITCPLCKVVNPVPKDKNEMTNWVNSLELNKDLLTKRLQTSDVVKQPNCDSCHAFGITTKATKICLGCFELFCISCSLGRHSGKLYNGHKVRDLDDENECHIRVKGLEEFGVLKQYSFCSDHDQRPFEYYCKTDNSFCCAKCLVINHRKCDDITDMQNIALENDIRDELGMTLESLDKLSTFAKQARNIAKKSEEDIKTQLENVRKSLEEIRRKVNDLVDALDASATDQAKAIIKAVGLRREQETETLSEAIDGLATCSSLIDKALEYGNTCQYYGVLRDVKEKIQWYRAVIMDTSDNFENVELELKPEAALQTLLDLGLNDTDKIANVIDKRQIASFRITSNEDVNLLKNYTTYKITEKQIKENYICLTSPTYSDIAFLPNDSAFLVDKCMEYCSLTNETYDVVSSYKILSLSCSCFKDGNVALSVPGERKIYIFSADKQLVLKWNISTNSIPAAIVWLRNGDIAVSWKQPVAFGIISCEETPTEKVNFCKDKAGRELKSFDYMAVDEVRKHVIQPCTDNEAVYCFDYEGNPKFKYTNVDLKAPRGVALDRDGNIYACSFSDTVIHIFSPTGRNIRIVKEGCPARPLAIAFKKNGEEFAVTNGTSDYRLVTFFKLQKQ